MCQCRLWGTRVILSQAKNLQILFFSFYALMHLASLTLSCLCHIARARTGTHTNKLAILTRVLSYKQNFSINLWHACFKYSDSPTYLKDPVRVLKMSVEKLTLKFSLHKWLQFSILISYFTQGTSCYWYNLILILSFWNSKKVVSNTTIT